MKSILAGLLATYGLVMNAPVADACGVKLTIKSAPPRRAAVHTARGTSVLLLGRSAGLKGDLSKAGNQVEVANDPSSAKRENYGVVVTDPSMADDARERFPRSVVIVRSGNNDADVAKVAQVASHQPVRGETKGTVVAATRTRAPIAAGPEPSRVIAAKEPTPTPTAAAVTPPPPAPAVATATPPPDETPAPVTPKPVTPKPAPPKHDVVATRTVEPHETAPAHAAAPVRAVRQEIYFPVGADSVPDRFNSRLDRIVKRLQDNADVRLSVEGFADPTGNHDANMELSQRRAEAVRDYLVGAGIDASRIDVQAFGDTKLKYGATDGRNRRVMVSEQK